MSILEAAVGPVPVTIPEVAVNLPDMRGALAAVQAKLRAHEGFTLFTVNLDHVVKLAESQSFCDAYKRADFVTADGWPVVWHIQQQRKRELAHKPVTVERRRVQRTTGADLLAPMCQQAAENGFPIYFVGPGPQSQADGIKVLQGRYPGLPVAGAETPMVPADFDNSFVEDLAARINQAGTQICVLSLGAPKQELLADALHSRCPNVGFICVGAALDFISGHAKRAPAWMRKTGLEWFWRMTQDPKRLVRRYALCFVALFKLRFPALFPTSPRLCSAETFSEPA